MIAGDELGVIREAQGALQAGDANRALSLLDEHSAANRQGILREERMAARVLALCELGRTDEARAEAARFLRESPASPLASRVRSACPAPAAPALTPAAPSIPIPAPIAPTTN
jgi:hypothetical protein